MATSFATALCVALRRRRRTSAPRALAAVRCKAADAQGAPPAPSAGAADGQSSMLNSASALLVLLAALYGGNNSLLKSVEGDAPIELTMVLLLALRFSGATAFMFPFVVSKGRALLAAAPAAIELGVWLFLGYSLQMLGLEKLSVATCSILFALCGIFVQLLELVFDGTPLSWTMMLSSLGALGGLAIFVNAPAVPVPTPPGVVEDNPLTGLLSNWDLQAKALVEKIFPGILESFSTTKQLPHQKLLEHVPGEALVLAGTFFFAVHCWRCAALVAEQQKSVAPAAPAEAGGKAAEAEPGQADDYALAVSAGQCFVAAVLAFGLSALDSPFSVQEQVVALRGLGQDVWLRILACGMLCTGLPHVLELWALRYVPPAQAALIYCTIPLWGAGFGIVLLGEMLSDEALAGGAVIMLCSLVPSLLNTLAESGDEGAARQEPSGNALGPQSAIDPFPSPATVAASMVVSSAASPEVVAQIGEISEHAG